MKSRIAAAAGRQPSDQALEKLDGYVRLLREETRRQNLIAASTIDSIWERHILDSAQLVRFEPRDGASWVDVGSGAGLPGVVIACLVSGPVTLIEPRRLRAEFLSHAVRELDLNAAVQPNRVERATGNFDVITARAVAPLAEFIGISHHLSTRNTVWALPKGRKAQSELVDARRTWQGMFHVEQSVTDEDSFIIIGSGVKKR